MIKLPTLKEFAGKPIEWKASISKDPHDADPDSLPVLELLTDEVYWAALRHGFHRPFVDIELGLYRALRRVMSPGAEPGC